MKIKPPTLVIVAALVGAVPTLLAMTSFLVATLIPGCSIHAEAERFNCFVGSINLGEPLAFAILGGILLARIVIPYVSLPLIGVAAVLAYAQHRRNVAQQGVPADGSRPAGEPRR